MDVILLLAIGVFLAVCALTFLPSLRLLYAKNPPFSGMVLTLVSSFLGVYMALHFSRSEERADRTARAATLMEMARESLSASQVGSEPSTSSHSSGFARGSRGGGAPCAASRRSTAFTSPATRKSPARFATATVSATAAWGGMRVWRSW